MNLNFGPSFVEIYDNALTKEECDILISEFEKSYKIRGSVLRGGNRIVDKEIKDSIELDDCFFSKSTLISSIISTRLDICLEKYKKKYAEDINTFLHIKRFDNYTFKKFDGEDAGFKTWHCEHVEGDEAPKRVLVWSFYLNDAKGTEFKYYPTVHAKRGRCAIFPASFNYMHRSAPNKGIKYITTGWVSYD
tara:strand:- start:98 stop:670 length:573 start_codon:yes stop_codon:yes gene_type:complete